jgi:hypothetical protein
MWCSLKDSCSAGLKPANHGKAESSMGGLPTIHTTPDQFDIGYHQLNLSDAQVDEVARKLQLTDNPDDNEFKQKLFAGAGMLQPTNEQLMICYKGRYVRINYQQGMPVTITPPG